MKYLFFAAIAICVVYVLIMLIGVAVQYVKNNTYQFKRKEKTNTGAFEDSEEETKKAHKISDEAVQDIGSFEISDYWIDLTASYEKQGMEKTTQNTATEFYPGYSLKSVTYNERLHRCKVVIIKFTKYKTIVRYVQRNYVKYPVYSDWKSRSKLIEKSISFTREDIERLKSNEDNLIAGFAFLILYTLKRTDLYPAWFYRTVYNLMHEKKAETAKEAILFFQASIKKEEERFSKDTKETRANIDHAREAKTALVARKDKIERKLQKSANATSFRYRCLEKKKQTIDGKTNAIDEQLNACLASLSKQTEEHGKQIAIYNSKIDDVRLLEERLNESYMRAMQEIGQGAVPEVLYDDTYVDPNEDLHQLNNMSTEIFEQKERIVAVIDAGRMEEAHHMIYEAYTSYIEFPISLHFLLLDCHRAVYSHRDEDFGNILFVLEICDLDMRLFDDGRITDGQDMCWPSAERKAIILEKENRYEEAISVCEWALDHGCREHDHSAYGFQKRIEKLRGKISSEMGKEEI